VERLDRRAGAVADLAGEDGFRGQVEFELVLTVAPAKSLAGVAGGLDEDGRGGEAQSREAGLAVGAGALRTMSSQLASW
jgi:hypothetical protein